MPAEAARRARGAGGAAAVAALATLAAVPAPGGESGAGGARSITLVTVDTLRADRLSAYGEIEPLTPHIDRLARGGELFTEARTVAPLTLPAHASLFTGEIPAVHGVRNNGSYRLPDSAQTLAERLRAQGFVTGAFVSSYVLHRSFGLGQGFDAYDDVAGVTTSLGPEVHQSARPGAVTVDRALGWLAERRAGPFFLWVHLFEPHVPYDPPPPFGSLPGGYEGEVAVADHEVGRLLRALASRTAGADVWIAADHGESLGEHGEPTHGTFLYEATARIPLVARRGRAAAIRTEPLSLASLSDLILGGAPHAGALLVSESLSPMLDLGWSPLYAVVEGRRKYVQAPRPELYDLEADPAELRNLARTEPAVARRLRQRLEAAIGASAGARADLPPEGRESLEALGYLGGGASARSAARSRGADPKDMVDLLPFLAEDGAGLAANVEAFLARDPGNPLVRLRKAWLLYAGGDLAAAEALFGVLARESTLGTAPHQGLAACRSQRKDWAGALEHFERASRLDPGDLTIPFNRGQILLFLGRAAEAVPLLERALPDESVGPQAAAALWQAARSGAATSWSLDREVDPAVLRAVARVAKEADAAVAFAAEGRAAEVEGLDAAALLARARAEPARREGYVARALRIAPDDPAVVREAARLAEARGDVEAARSLRRRLGP